MNILTYASGAASLDVLAAHRADPKIDRIRWMLTLPDLSRQQRSPVRYLVQQALEAPCLHGADEVIFPEIISTRRNFDLLNTPPRHPSRRPSDTYYVDSNHVLRTQTTSMWTWYLTDPKVADRLKDEGQVLAVSYGKVYRNDEIDRRHFPVFHQVDAVCIARRDRCDYTQNHLDEVLLQIARVIYGEGVESRILDDSFPFTSPSRQLEVKWNDEWLEVVGSGLVHSNVLRMLDIDPDEHCGWAFGFGLDRLAMAKMDIPDIRILWSTDERVLRQFDSPNATYTPVSKYPSTTRDVSFIVDKETSVNDFYEIVRACGLAQDESIVEQVEHLDSYENAEKFGAGRTSHTFRVIYRSFLRTLTNDEINRVQERIRSAVTSELHAQLR